MDHPCQLKTIYRIKDVGFIHFFDKGITEDTPLYKGFKKKINFQRDILGQELVVTTPFSFDWTTKGIIESEHGDIYVKRHTDKGLCFLNINDDLKESGLDSTGHIFWVYENEFTARILISSFEKSFSLYFVEYL